MKTIVLAIAAIAVLAAAPPAAAQGGNRVPNPSLGLDASQRTRLDILEEAFDLTGDQKDAVEAIFDQANADAGQVREMLATARAAIATAIIEDQGDAALTAAIEGYAVPVAAMTAYEMKAMADMLRSLTPEQQGNGAAVRTAFFLVRGMFLDERRWNTIPEHRGY